MYAQTVRDQPHLGLLLFYDQAVAQLQEMVPIPWDILVDVEDVGMDVDYNTYWVDHPCPWLTDLGEPIEGDGGDGGGRGRRWRRGAVAKRRVV